MVAKGAVDRGEPAAAWGQNGASKARHRIENYSAWDIAIMCLLQLGMSLDPGDKSPIATGDTVSCFNC